MLYGHCGGATVKQAFQAGSLSEAYLMRDLLEGHGVEVELRGEDTANMAFQLPSASIWPSLWVSEESLDRAHSILAEYETDVSKIEVAPPWRCSKCGEESEALFSSCWSCQTERDPKSPE